MYIDELEKALKKESERIIELNIYGLKVKTNMRTATMEELDKFILEQSNN